MVIRVEKLSDDSYCRHIAKLNSTLCNLRSNYLENKIKRSQKELDSFWDSFSHMGVHRSVLESMYNSRKGVMDEYIEEKRLVDDIASGNIVYFSLDCDCLGVEWDNLLVNIEMLLQEGKIVKFCIDGDIESKSNDSSINYTYSREDLFNIGRVDCLLKRYNQEGVMFKEESRIKDYRDYKNLWSYEEVKYANDRIDEIVSFINSSDMSPFEIMLYIHEYITNNFVYDDKTNNGIDPRVLPGVFKNGSIVCSGYASIVKAIIDKLHNPYLKCMIVGCTLRRPESAEELQHQYSNHCHNLIHIKDSKYGINGFYIEDSCWDSRVEGKKDGYGISNCLYPVEDVFHHNNIEYYHRFYDSRKKNVLETVVHPYFRKPSRYKNKDKVAQLVRLYKSRSTPIELDTYRKGMEVVSPLLEVDANKEIDKSIEVASVLCDEDALNCFSRQRDKRIK